MSPFFAFLHHLAAFTVVAALVIGAIKRCQELFSPRPR